MFSQPSLAHVIYFFTRKLRDRESSAVLSVERLTWNATFDLIMVRSFIWSKDYRVIWIVKQTTSKLLLRAVRFVNKAVDKEEILAPREPIAITIRRREALLTRPARARITSPPSFSVTLAEEILSQGLRESRAKSRFPLEDCLKFDLKSLIIDLFRIGARFTQPLPRCDQSKLIRCGE